MSKNRNMIWGGNPENNPEWKFEKKGVSGLNDKERRQISRAINHSKAWTDIDHYVRNTKYLKEGDLAKILTDGITEGRYAYKDVKEALRVLGADSAKTRSHLKRAKKIEEEQASEENKEPVVEKETTDSAVSSDVNVKQNDQVQKFPSPDEYFSNREDHRL